MFLRGSESLSCQNCLCFSTRLWGLLSGPYPTNPTDYRPRPLKIYIICAMCHRLLGVYGIWQKYFPGKTVDKWGGDLKVMTINKKIFWSGCIGQGLKSVERDHSYATWTLRTKEIQSGDGEKIENKTHDGGEQNQKRTRRPLRGKINANLRGHGLSTALGRGCAIDAKSALPSEWRLTQAFWKRRDSSYRYRWSVFHNSLFGRCSSAAPLVLAQ